MALTGKQLARLGELLDQSLPLSIEQRRAWLETLPAEDEPLRRTLNDALLSEAPASHVTELLSRPPCVAQANPAQRAGERLGAYELMQPLGAGGMADVWLARRADGAFERQVALKIPRLSQLPGGIPERFTRECHILASLEFPGIARLYDAGIDERGVPYIAMEYVKGEPLTTWCDVNNLSPADRMALFVKVLEVVGRAHAQHVIHRDLKPSNILVTPEGDVRLLDFGIARLLQADTAGSTVTQAWGRALTPEYASPEMLRGAPVDIHSDIYSLGVVLQELLTGGRPGAGGDAFAKLPAELRAVLSRALAPSPADRFASAADFAAALRPCILPARPPVARFLLVAGTVVALLTAGLWIFANRAPAPPTSAAPVPMRDVSLAVLPFTDLSATRDQGYLSEGIADEIINQLAQVPALRTVGLRSSLAFKGRNEDLRVIGEKLGVENLLDGTIRKNGEKLRLSAQLVRARDGTPLWSKTYDRELRDVFAVQDEIARDVASALSVKLDVGPMNRAQGGTTNLDAYDRYLKWRQLKLAEREGFEESRVRTGLLREAVQFDPGFVLAWGELARELETLAGYSEAMADKVGGSQSTSLRAEAGAARARVLELAPESWVALRIRSEQLANEKRWAESIAVAHRILETGPFTLERAYPYLDVIFCVGHIDEVIEMVERLIKIEPGVMYLSRDQQWNLSGGRRYAEAEAEYQRSRKLDGWHGQPDNIALLRALGVRPVDRAKLHVAYERFRSGQKPEEKTSYWGQLGSLLDDRTALRAFVRNVVDTRQPDFEYAALLADAVGEPEVAIEALQAMLAHPNFTDFRKYWQPWIMPYSSVRTLPGWKRIMADAGVVDYWRTTGKWGDFCKPLGADDFECR